MYQSYTQELSTVSFPEFTGERVYMQKFYKEQGLPSYLSRWQDTIDQMLLNVETEDPIFLMIDQGVVKPQTTHRRPGPHIDGYWIEDLKAHGGSGGHRMSAMGWDTGGECWSNVNLSTPESIILASDVQGCKGYNGNWEGLIGEGGDCSAIDLSGLTEFHLKPNVAYRGNVGFIHESTPLASETKRTLVRLSLKNV